MSQRLTVAVTVNLPQPLSYQAPDEIHCPVGTRVLVPLGNRISTAWVVEPVGNASYSGRLKSILARIEDPFQLSPAYLRGIATLASTYLQSQGLLLESALPADLKASKGFELYQDGKWNKWDGTSRLQGLAPAGDLPRLRVKGSETLLHAARQNDSPLPAFEMGELSREWLGPGRWAEIRSLWERIRAAGRSLLTVAGDAHSIDLMAEKLPQMTPYHSQIPAKERRRIWQAIQSGEALWLIGGVSAALLPIPNLAGLLILDAHNPAHFSRFHRDYGAGHLLRVRSREEGMPLWLSSPAPTLLGAWLTLGVTQEKASYSAPLHPVQVIPARWGRPEALERLSKALSEGVRNDLRSLYVVSGKEEQGYWCGECRRLFSIAVGESCPNCKNSLKRLSRPSVAWLKRILALRCDPHQLIEYPPDESVKSASSQIVIAEANQLPHIDLHFDRVVLIGPESWISLDEIDGALRLWGMMEGVRELVHDTGEIQVYSAFHFHYALKLINDAKAFFERELNYRTWFKLPPLCGVYQVEMRSADLRGLARKMRAWQDRFQADETVKIDQLRIVSRQPYRGTYKGGFVFHGQAEQIWQSGLFPDKMTAVKLLMA